MPANRSHHLGAMREVQGRRNAAAAAAVVAIVVLSWFLVGCQAQPKAIVVDDFESGAITNWQAVGGGSGGWFVYSDGQKRKASSVVSIGRVASANGVARRTMSPTSIRAGRRPQ
jgi:hypothetical protein